MIVALATHCVPMLVCVVMPERTLLARVRTGLAMMGFGFVVARFGPFMRELLVTHGTEPPRRLGLTLGVGTAMVLLGVVVCASAALQHWRRMRRLAAGQTLRPGRLSLAMIVAMLLAALGIVMVAYLLGTR